MTGLYERAGALTITDQGEGPDRDAMRAAPGEDLDAPALNMRSDVDDLPEDGSVLARRDLQGERSLGHDLAEGSDPPPRPRRAPLQRALSGQSVAARALLALGSVGVLAAAYLFTPVFGGGSAPDAREVVANPLVADARVGTGLMVAAGLPTEPAPSDPLLASSAPDVALFPEIQSTNGDVDGLLRSLNARQAKLDALSEELNEAERARDASRGDVTRLEDELKAVRLEAATARKTHEAQMRQLKQQHKLDISRAVAEALASVPTYPQQPEEQGLSPEEARLIEERRRLRAAQLRSKSIVYDGITD